jgi:hypothetical protein
MPSEEKWYALTGRVVDAKVEADGDIHIALEDVTGNNVGTLSAETSSNSLIQRITACLCAAKKAVENPSRPNGAWPGLRNTTSLVIKVSKRARSPAFTASIHMECTSWISRSSVLIWNLC